jgi:hypothetical protein
VFSRIPQVFKKPMLHLLQAAALGGGQKLKSLGRLVLQRLEFSIGYWIFDLLMDVKVIQVGIDSCRIYYESRLRFLVQLCS